MECSCSLIRAGIEWIRSSYLKAVIQILSVLQTQPLSREKILKYQKMDSDPFFDVKKRPGWTLRLTIHHKSADPIRVEKNKRHGVQHPQNCEQRRKRERNNDARKQSCMMLYSVSFVKILCVYYIRRQMFQKVPLKFIFF